MSEHTRKTEPAARGIAFYLPQFHPIPENDKWWGKGFTEWTNVAKAKPLFKGHHQPNLPADLGFYDLRVPDVREAQAELARQHGIEGFCYWHYWFGNGKRLLERPFEEVLKSGKPDFPFCLGWANQTWTGVWHGAPDRILVEQTYPGRTDYERHFLAIRAAFEDPRYVRVDGLPLFVVYAPQELPNPLEFTDCWRELALKEGLGGVHFTAIAQPGWPVALNGFDSMTLHPPFNLKRKRESRSLIGKLLNNGKPNLLQYEELVSRFGYGTTLGENCFPTVIPNWDNTPRSGRNGVVLLGSSPESFRKHFELAIKSVEGRLFQRRIVFIKSWNEWAEGNYLEPDMVNGKAFLETIKSLLGCN